MKSVEIPLLGQYSYLSTKIDEEDFQLVSMYSWCGRLSGRDTNIRVVARDCGHNRNILLSRLVMRVVDSNNTLGIDHKNGDTLDNRKSNLRLCTQSQNMANTMSKLGTSKYKGVSWVKHSQKWRSCIKVNYRQHALGCYSDEKDAALAYDKAAVKFFGNFAKLNFPIYLTT